MVGLPTASRRTGSNGTANTVPCCTYTRWSSHQESSASASSDHAPLTRLERLCHDPQVGPTASEPCAVEERTPPGQNIGVVVFGLPPFERSHSSRRASCCRDAPDTAGPSRVEENGIVRFPAQTTAFGEFAHCQGHAAGDGDFHELELSRECDPLAVRRERRIVRALRAWNGFAVELIQFSEVQLLAAAGRGDVGKTPAVRR